MFFNTKTVALIFSMTGFVILSGCVVAPSNNGAYNGKHQHADHKSGASEWDRGCGDAKSGAYDRSGNAGQDYEQGWNSCKNGDGQSSSASSSSAPIGQTPPVAQDLVGARASGAMDELERRGLKYVRVEEYGNGKFSYWKELGTEGCIAVRTTEGKIETATYTETTKCH
jgi:hypothetical protein